MKSPEGKNYSLTTEQQLAVAEAERIIAEIKLITEARRSRITAARRTKKGYPRNPSFWFSIISPLAAIFSGLAIAGISHARIEQPQNPLPQISRMVDLNPNHFQSSNYFGISK